MHNDMFEELGGGCPEDADWDMDDDVYDWDDPDWREETDWSDLYGDDVQRADVIASRD